MKGVLLFMLVFTLTMSSCLKDPGLVYRYEGTIKGENPFTRNCGGAYWIIINGYDYSHDSVTTFDSLPAKSGLDLSKIQLPMSVKLNWHHKFGDTCGIIEIDDIEQIR